MANTPPYNVTQLIAKLRQMAAGVTAWIAGGGTWEGPSAADLTAAATDPHRRPSWKFAFSRKRRSISSSSNPLTPRANPPRVTLPRGEPYDGPIRGAEPPKREQPRFAVPHSQVGDRKRPKRHQIRFPYNRH